VSLDELLPEWHVRERHRRVTSAPAAALLAAAEQVTWSEVPVMSVLMGIRSAGRLRRVAGHRVLDDMAAAGFTVLCRTGDELVLAALGRPWAPRGSQPPRLAGQADPAGFFTGYTAPGWAKMAVNFRVVSAGELATEHRVLLTDQRSRRAFGRHWLLIRPFSGLIRRQWLAAIARRQASHERPGRTAAIRAPVCGMSGRFAASRARSTCGKLSDPCQHQGREIRTPAASARRLRRRVAAWRSIRAPLLLSRIGPRARAADRPVDGPPDRWW
jgi:hypothetical protein